MPYPTSALPGTNRARRLTTGGSTVAGAWQTASVNLSSYAGQNIRVQIEAADASTGSLIELGVDDVKITKR